MKPAILFLGSQMAVAGAQEVLLTQASWFHQQGYPVTAAFFYDKENLHTEWQARYDFPVLNLRARKPGAPRWRNALATVGAALRLFFLLIFKRIRIIETFTPDSNLLGLLVAWLARVPVRMATHHGFIEGSPHIKERLHGVLINRRVATSLVAVSEQVAQLSIAREGTHREKVTVIENGISPLPRASDEACQALREELGMPVSAPLLLCVGRLTVQKGHKYLIEAAPAILQKHPQAVFALAGDGPLREDLLAQARNLGIESNIRLLGIRTDIPSLLSAADLFVMPSEWEGLSIALLEAMSLGLPVVVTEVEGVRHLLDDGENGRMVAPKDPAALAAAILEMLASPENRKRMGQAGQVLVEARYTVARMCHAYEEIFLAQLENKA